MEKGYGNICFFVDWNLIFLFSRCCFFGEEHKHYYIIGLHLYFWTCWFFGALLYSKEKGNKVLKKELNF